MKGRTVVCVIVSLAFVALVIYALFTFMKRDKKKEKKTLVFYTNEGCNFCTSFDPVFGRVKSETPPEVMSFIKVDASSSKVKNIVGTPAVFLVDREPSKQEIDDGLIDVKNKREYKEFPRTYESLVEFLKEN
jgi:thiol-disulfide isomerase/thioredoxin